MKRRIVCLGLLACWVGLCAGQATAQIVPPDQELPQPPSFNAQPEYTEPEPSAETLTEEIPDWQARWELARLLSYVQRYEESLTEYRKLLDEKPDLDQARTEMASVYFWSGQPDRALAVLQELSPTVMPEKTRLMMADLYVAKGEYSKAETIYNDHLALHPEALEVRVKLAEVLSWSKRYEESLAQYRKVLEAAPDDAQIRRKYAYVLIWAGKHREAIEQLRKTLE